SLGAGNVPFWLGERGDDLAKPRLWLDRAWVAPGGESKDSLGLGDILAAAGAYRKMYRELGVQAGDVVVTRIRTPIDVYLHWVALAAEGAIAAPVNSNLPDDGVDRYARRIAALGCLVENDAADCEPGTLTWRSSKTGEAATVVAAALRGAVDEPAYAHRPEDIVLLCHTSGTTGDPKAVSCSHHGFMVGILDQ